MRCAGGLRKKTRSWCRARQVHQCGAGQHTGEDSSGITPRIIAVKLRPGWARMCVCGLTSASVREKSEIIIHVVEDRLS